MAIVYYPKNSVMYKRDTTTAGYEQVVLNLNPGEILYFDTASNVTALQNGITDSISSSYSFTSSYINPGASASFATTSSYSSNAANSKTTLNGASSSFFILPVQSAKISVGTSGSWVVAGQQNWELQLDKSGSAIWQFRMPINYSASLLNTIQFYATASQGSNAAVIWDFWTLNINPTASVVVTSSVFTLTAQVTSSMAGTAAGVINTLQVWLTGSSVDGGDFFLYKLGRNTGSGDTGSGSIAVISNTLEWITA
jgi:hypothetical protein